MRVLNSRKTVRAFLADRRGGITIWSLFNLMMLFGFAGLALDVNNAVQARQQLQAAADAAGHAAIYYRYRETSKGESYAIDKAKTVAAQNMPTTVFGSVLATADVEFGNWDNVDRVFTPKSGDTTAVRVTTRRIASRANAVRTFLLKFIGIDTLNLNTVSVWDDQDGFCPPRSPDKKRGEGFFALGVVDMQSQNDYFDGFCIHSQQYVKLSTDNYFQKGVVVSMPDKGNLQLPSGGMEKNPGLPDALKSYDYNLTSFFDNLPTLANSYFSASSSVQPSYVTDKSTVNTVAVKPSDSIDMTMLKANKVKNLTCNKGNQTLSIANGAVIKDVVIVTNCKVSFGNDSSIQNATLVTTSTDKFSITGGSGMKFGSSDYCTTGKGGVTLLTLGGFSFSAALEAHGLDLSAAGDVSMTAQADGLAGINVMSGGTISVTSKGGFGFCNSGAPQDFIKPVFRMMM